MELSQSILLTVDIFLIIVLAAAQRVLKNLQYILVMITSLYQKILCNFKFTKFEIRLRMLIVQH